jgi:hypothetical protein
VAAPLWQAVEAARGEGPSATLLYLNVPAWVAPKEATYRVGTEGLTFIPEYVRVQDSVYVNSGVEPEIRAYMFDPLKQDWEAYIGYAGYDLDQAGLAEEIRQADGVYLTAYGPGGLRFVEAGALEAAGGSLGGGAEVARFGDSILLFDPRATLHDTELELELRWVAQQVPDGNTTVFVHVYDEGGQLIAQRDGYPLSGLYPASRWEPGDWVRDVRLVALPEDLISGRYRVVVGWYDADTGERLPAFDQKDRRVGQDAVQVFEFARPAEINKGKP